MRYLATKGRGEYIQLNREDCDSALTLQNSTQDSVSDAIETTFLGLTDHIRSVYHFNYSSQQTHGKSTLELQLQLTDGVDDSLTLPARPVE